MTSNFFLQSQNNLGHKGSPELSRKMPCSKQDQLDQAAQKSAQSSVPISDFPACQLVFAASPILSLCASEKDLTLPSLHPPIKQIYIPL